MLQGEIVQRSCPREGVTPFLWTLLRHTPPKNTSPICPKKSGESSSFQQRDGFVFRASLLKLSLSSSHARAKAALFRTTRVSLYSESDSDSD